MEKEEAWAAWISGAIFVMKSLTGTKFGIEYVPNGISEEIEPKDC